MDWIQIVMSLIVILLGFVACCLSGRIVGRIKRVALREIDMVEPEGLSREEWNSLVSPPGDDEAGRYLGILERILAFVSFYTPAYILVAGWLAFKVASKWQVWTNIIRVPDKLDTSTSSFSFLKARRRWGGPDTDGLSDRDVREHPCRWGHRMSYQIHGEHIALLVADDFFLELVLASAQRGRGFFWTSRQRGVVGNRGG